jgi:hypothetical protein
MKLKTYPGHAIDANYSASSYSTSDSNQTKSTMGLLYEANWIATGEKIQLPTAVIPVKSPTSQNVYPQNFMKYVNGYKPATIRMKQNMKLHDEWDCDKSSNTPNATTPMFNPIYNHTKNNRHSTEYLIDSKKSADSKIKRSQTVVVKQPTSSHRVLNHKRIDIYGSRNNLRQNENIEYSLNASSSIFLKGSFGTEQCDENKSNCDIYNRIKAKNSEKSKTNSDLSSASSSSSSSNRMKYYQTLRFPTARKSSYSTLDEQFNKKCLLNPLAKNGTIRLKNHSNNNTNININNDEVRESESKASPKKEKKSSLSKMFYNTISAGSKLPKVFLGRSKSQRTKLNLEELRENSEEISYNNHDNNSRNVSSSTSSSSTLSTASPISFKSAPNMNDYKANPRLGAASNAESFVIPRPRFKLNNDSAYKYAEPVHTFARKRRTGNLTKNQNGMCKENKSDCSTSQGKINL